MLARTNYPAQRRAYTQTYTHTHTHTNSFIHPFTSSTQALDRESREEFANVTRWFLTCANQPQFVSVLGESELPEEIVAFDPEAYLG